MYYVQPCFIAVISQINLKPVVKGTSLPQRIAISGGDILFKT